MKPFNLEAAMHGEPIVCRDGTPAKFIAYVPEAEDFSVVVALVDGIVRASHIDGRCVRGENISKDLFMASTKRTVWVNFYPDGAAEWFDSEFAALNCARSLLTNGRAYPVEVEE